MRMRNGVEDVENWGVVEVAVVVVVVVMMVELRFEAETVHADAKTATAWQKVDRWVAHPHRTGDLECRRH